MTDNELEALRHRISDLELALEAERRERAALPKLLVPQAAETRRALAELETTLEMNVRAFDARIAEVAAREPSASGPPLSLEVARAAADYVREILARDSAERRLAGTAVRRARESPVDIRMRPRPEFPIERRLRPVRWIASP